MNKIKDFLYDVSDLFLSLLIIGIIFFVVSWKLTDTMAMSWFSNINDSSIENLEFEESSTPDTSILPPVTEEIDTSTEITEVTEVEDSETKEIVEIRDVLFIIEPGSAGYKIAKQLKEEELITDTDEFINTLGELGLGSKLRAGTFKLNTGMNMVEIINKLTGQ